MYKNVIQLMLNILWFSSINCKANVLQVVIRIIYNFISSVNPFNRLPFEGNGYSMQSLHLYMGASQTTESGTWTDLYSGATAVALLRSTLKAGVSADCYQPAAASSLNMFSPDGTCLQEDNLENYVSLPLGQPVINDLMTRVKKGRVLALWWVPTEWVTFPMKWEQRQISPAFTSMPSFFQTYLCFPHLPQSLRPLLQGITCSKFYFSDSACSEYRWTMCYPYWKKKIRVRQTLKLLLFFWYNCRKLLGFPGCTGGKSSACQCCGDVGSVLRL